MKIRAVVQRVSHATVLADGESRGKIQAGLLVLYAVGRCPPSEGAELEESLLELRACEAKLIDKLLGLRTFSHSADSRGKMDLSLNDVGGALALVSQFTLFADLRKGARPGFQNAAPPQLAKESYLRVESALRERLGEQRFVSGVFAADMQLSFTNDGPVTYVFEVEKGQVRQL